jgi:mitochondrial-processing peptidase subunit alpha
MSCLFLYGYSFHPCTHQQLTIIVCFPFPIQGSSCSVGVYVDCGSVYEAPETTGASQLLKTMAFTTTANRSELRVVREIEAIGGSAKASASREMMSYTYGALKTYMPEMVEVLIDCVRNPAFLDWEVKEQVIHLVVLPFHMSVLD